MSTRQQPLPLESAAAVGMLAYEEGIRPLVSKADRHERRVARRKPVPQVVEGQSETTEGKSPQGQIVPEVIICIA